MRFVPKIGFGDRLNAVSGHRTGFCIRFCRFDPGEELVTIWICLNQRVRRALE